MAQNDEGMKRLLTVEELADGIDERVTEFARRYIALPRMAMPCVVMDIGQLRDAMCLRVTPEGDEWKAAEPMLRERGMMLQMMGGVRVMFLRERDDFVENDGWTPAIEVKSEE